MTTIAFYALIISVGSLITFLLFRPDRDRCPAWLTTISGGRIRGRLGKEAAWWIVMTFFLLPLVLILIGVGWQLIVLTMVLAFGAGIAIVCVQHLIFRAFD